jgi:aspartate/methionine/tyrosine aminotransferase
MFSSRTPADLAPNALANALAGFRARGSTLLDLTESNPTRAGLAAPADLLLALASPASVSYEPQPLGLAPAREAVAADYLRAGLEVRPDRVVLTSSTSEAYSFLFKLLCDPGDEVLVPVPSYPLFEYLTRLDGVTPRPYPIEYHGTWSIDFEALERSLTARTRAILVVSPNNPTGSLLRRRDLEHLSALAAGRHLALVGDEVFADYPLEPAGDGCRVLDCEEALTFALGGLSKSVGLPQLKLGWIAAGGPEVLCARALARLEVIGDAYLSVSTPVQHAAGPLLAAGQAVQRAIAARVRSNLDRLREAAVGSACSLLRAEGGWSAVLHIPAMRPEEEVVLALLEQHGVLVHPGYFFDFPREAYLVLSLLPDPAVFSEGVSRLIAHLSSGF